MQCFVVANYMIMSKSILYLLVPYRWKVFGGGAGKIVSYWKASFWYARNWRKGYKNNFMMSCYFWREVIILVILRVGAKMLMRNATHEWQAKRIFLILFPGQRWKWWPLFRHQKRRIRTVQGQESLNMPHLTLHQQIRSEWRICKQGIIQCSIAGLTYNEESPCYFDCSIFVSVESNTDWSQNHWLGGRFPWRIEIAFTFKFFGRLCQWLHIQWPPIFASFAHYR